MEYTSGIAYAEHIAYRYTLHECSHTCEIVFPFALYNTHITPIGNVSVDDNAVIHPNALAQGGYTYESSFNAW